MNLFRRSELSLDEFCAKPGRPFPTKRKMGYFFAVLEDQRGLKATAARWTPAKVKMPSFFEALEDQLGLRSSP